MAYDGDETGELQFGEVVVIDKDGSPGMKFPFMGRATLGRAEGSDIRINLPYVSRQHARLTVDENGEVVLENLCKKPNMTLVNNEAVIKRAVLETGAIFTIVDRRFMWTASDSLMKAPEECISKGEKEKRKPQVAEGDALKTNQMLSNGARPKTPKTPKTAVPDEKREKLEGEMEDIFASAKKPKSGRKKTLPTPMRRDISQRATDMAAARPKAKAMPTPLRSGIQAAAGGRKVNVLDKSKALPTPLRKEIRGKESKAGKVFEKKKSALATPVREAIKQGAPLLKQPERFATLPKSARRFFQKRQGLESAASSPAAASVVSAAASSVVASSVESADLLSPARSNYQQSAEDSDEDFDVNELDDDVEEAQVVQDLCDQLEQASDQDERACLEEALMCLGVNPEKYSDWSVEALEQRLSSMNMVDEMVPAEEIEYGNDEYADDEDAEYEEEGGEEDASLEQNVATPQRFGYAGKHIQFKTPATTPGSRSVTWTYSDYDEEVEDGNASDSTASVDSEDEEEQLDMNAEQDDVLSNAGSMNEMDRTSDSEDEFDAKSNQDEQAGLDLNAAVREVMAEEDSEEEDSEEEIQEERFSTAAAVDTSDEACLSADEGLDAELAKHVEAMNISEDVAEAATYETFEKSVESSDDELEVAKNEEQESVVSDAEQEAAVDELSEDEEQKSAAASQDEEEEEEHASSEEEQEQEEVEENVVSLEDELNASAMSKHEETADDDAHSVSLEDELLAGKLDEGIMSEDEQSAEEDNVSQANVQTEAAAAAGDNEAESSADEMEDAKEELSEDEEQAEEAPAVDSEAEDLQVEAGEPLSEDESVAEEVVDSTANSSERAEQEAVPETEEEEYEVPSPSPVRARRKSLRLMTPAKAKKEEEVIFANPTPAKSARRKSLGAAKAAAEHLDDEEEEEELSEEMHAVRQKLSELKVKELRPLLKEHGLDTKGKKSDMIQRMAIQILEAPLEERERFLAQESPKSDGKRTILIPSQLTVNELKGELAARGIEGKGRKAELVETLQQAVIAEEQSHEDLSAEGEKFVKTDHELLWKPVAKELDGEPCDAVVVGVLPPTEEDPYELFRVRFLDGDVEDLERGELDDALELYKSIHC